MENVDVALIFAVMEHESSFDPNARSESGDSGLMQVNDINLETLKKELGIDDIFATCSETFESVLLGGIIVTGSSATLSVLMSIDVILMGAVVLFVLIFHKKDKPAPISITSIDISTESVAL
mgnify:CR=1 FL=1